MTAGKDRTESGKGMLDPAWKRGERLRRWGLVASLHRAWGQWQHLGAAFLCVAGTGEHMARASVPFPL